MDSTKWRDFPRNPTPTLVAPSKVLCSTKIKCSGTGQFSKLSLIVLLIAWLYSWVLNVVNGKKLRHHKTKARFKT